MKVKIFYLNYKFLFSNLFEIPNFFIFKNFKNYMFFIFSEKYRLSTIHVVFGESQIKKTSKYVTYEMENFVFDIGGLIGLFLGSSILSVLELLVSICKTIKNRAEKVFIWFYPRAESDIIEPVNSVQSQSTDMIDEIRSHDADELSADSTLSSEMRMFVISGRHDLSSALRTVQHDDINVEDLEN